MFAFLTFTQNVTIANSEQRHGHGTIIYRHWNTTYYMVNVHLKKKPLKAILHYTFFGVALGPITQIDLRLVHLKLICEQ